MTSRTHAQPYKLDDDDVQTPASPLPLERICGDPHPSEQGIACRLEKGHYPATMHRRVIIVNFEVAGDGYKGSRFFEWGDVKDGAEHDG